ncbi:MAG TPA: DUF1223 domain-containing protein [Hyphomicrobiaceae bacterium]|nr:DUF1223 domain-containing protein [Hyphomicrobiaceae bacterium]
MRSFAIVALGGLAALLGAPQARAEGTAAATSLADSAQVTSVTSATATSPQVKAVYELYTSQGCSTCPAADALLGRLAAQRDDILALTLPVDIWDYLGWRDTLARPEFADRQKAYARTLGDGMVYTPQAVVSGLVHVNGSNAEKVELAIDKTAKRFAGSRVPISLSVSTGRFVIDVAAAPAGLRAPKAATVWVLAIARNVKVPITRGENRGRTIVYTNVVRRMMPIGTWSGKEMVVELDPRSFMTGDCDRSAVLLQQGRGGPIVGAAVLEGKGT